MVTGVALAILAGCFFSAGALLFAQVAKRGLPFILFLSMGAWVGLSIGMPSNPKPGPVRCSCGSFPVFPLVNFQYYQNFRKIA